MKIVHVCTRFNKNRLGGVERVVLELSRAMQKRGHEVTILCRNEGDEPETEEFEGICIKRADCLNKKGLHTLTSMRSLSRLIKKEDADIFNTHDWSPTIPFLLQKFDSPYLMTSHGFYAETKDPFLPTVLMEKYALAAAKKPIICVQKRSKSTDYLEKFDFEYVPNGVNIDKFGLSETQGEYALFVGKLIGRKNIENICEAFDILRDEGENIPFKVVGDGPLKSYLEDKYPGIEFLGHKKDEELINLYKNSKFFVMPSRFEGFGVVWVEAVASGKPIIASDTGVGPDIVQNDDFGRIIEHPDEEGEIADAILSLNEQVEKGNVDRLKLRREIEENYSWSSIAEKYVEIYHRILEEK